MVLRILKPKRIAVIVHRFFHEAKNMYSSDVIQIGLFGPPEAVALSYGRRWKVVHTQAIWVVVKDEK